MAVSVGENQASTLTGCVRELSTKSIISPTGILGLLRMYSTIVSKCAGLTSMRGMWMRPDSLSWRVLLMFCLTMTAQAPDAAAFLALTDQRQSVSSASTKRWSLSSCRFCIISQAEKGLARMALPERDPLMGLKPMGDMWEVTAGSCCRSALGVMTESEQAAIPMSISRRNAFLMGQFIFNIKQYISGMRQIWIQQNIASRQ